jgi:hypothetical protein
MEHRIDRRDFGKRMSMAIGSLATGTSVGGAMPIGEGREPADKRLVRLGINGLARAHQFDYFADGHRGASMVAAQLMCTNNGLDDRTTARIAELFDLNWASSPLCKPFPDAEPRPGRIAEIGVALAKGGGVLRQVGHDAIFAMLAIKAFRMVPEAATPQRIDGVCRLIRSFTPWHDVKPDPDIDPPPFVESAAASRFILREAMAAIDRFIGFGQGFSGHMLTFGQALVELAAMGDVEWAESCRTAFRKYVTVTRQGPASDARRYPEHQPSKLRPTTLAYWKKRGGHAVDIGHVFKYPYSCYELLRCAGDPALERAWDEQAYHLF